MEEKKNLKEDILSNYGSLLEFCRAFGYPYKFVNRLLKSPNGSKYDSYLKQLKDQAICKRKKEKN